MGGFKPSRADIAGSTIVGSDKDLDTHAFTGSVDITGSLTLNGSAVTGGGGGGTPGGATTQIQYNDAGSFAGSANLTFDGSNLTTTGSLYLSSSAVGSNVPLLRLDHAGAGVDNPILFVTGSGRVGIGTGTPTAVLHISSSGTGPLLRVDHSGQSGSAAAPLLYITSSAHVDGEAMIGIGTNAPSRNGIHIKSTTGTGINIEADTRNTPETYDRTAWINMTSDNGATRLVLGTTNQDDLDPFGVYLGGAKPNTAIIGPRSTGVALHFVTSNKIKTTLDDSGHFGVGQSFSNLNLPTAIVHISGSEANVASNSPLLNVEHDANSNILFVTGSGRVGIGTGTPVEALDVADDTDASARIGRAHIGYNGLNPDEAIFAHRDRANSGDYALLQRADGTTILNTIAGGTLYVRTGGNSPALIVAGAHNNNIGINTSAPTARLHISASAVENDVLRVDGPGTNLHALYVSGSGHVGIGTGTPIQTLSVSGSAAFSGSFGSTAIETRSTDLGVLSATDGVSIIDLTAAAINTSFTFSIDNGTFIGQQKSIYVKTIIGATGANSNDAKLQGTNIDSAQALASGQLWLSGSDGGGGFFGWSRGGAVLFWDGTYWAPTSVANLYWN